MLNNQLSIPFNVIITDIAIDENQVHIKHR